MGRLGSIARQTAAHFIPQLAGTVHCGGCGRAKDAVAQLVAGPGVYVCDECFAQAAQRLPPRRPPSNALRCQFCRLLRSPDDITRIGSVDTCADCLGSIDVILADARETSQPAT
jgi:hypothetical protein